MKRIIAILICVTLFMTTTVFGNGKIPEELQKYPENFTAATSISISIDDNSDIRKLIEEVMNADGAVSGMFGSEFLALLSAIFEYDGTVNVQADLSSDYKKIKLAVTNNNVLSSVVSSNLNYTVKTNSGIWADIDLTDVESPKCDVIFLLPTSDKYHYINAGKYITQDDINGFNQFPTSDELQKMIDEFTQLLYNNSTFEKTKTGYKLFMDNDNYVTYMNEVAKYTSGYYMGIEAETEPIFQNMQFLGKDGLTAVYTLKNGKISRSEIKADISINISDIVKATGEEWPFEASGIINIKLSEKIDFTQIGTTVVKYPVLNDGNSISLNEMIDEQMYPDEDYDFAYEFDYPYGYVEVSGSTLPVVNGDYYVPLRGVLEDGYSDTVSIDYQNGVITASCEFFDGFNTLKMTIGDDKVYVDDSEYALGTIMCTDGVTYVSTRLFTEVFGWELSNVTHEILDNSFSVGFWTTD